MTHRWDPQRYLAYADERGRPFVELVARVRADDPRRVVDLGCGPGNLTALLAQRWPAARVEGVDSSPEMIERATRDVPGIDFRVADLRAWAAAADEPVDVLVSNATLQWVPGHLDLLPALVDRVAPGGTLAFQVPGNFDEPSHVIRAELAAEEPYAPHTRDVAVPAAHGAAPYLRALQGLGCEVDAWETTYLHILDTAVDPDPVFTWVSGTGARPTLQALPDDLRPAFEEELKRRLRAAYPDSGHGVVLPFRRVFVVATRPASH
ncbi:trans-aconitate 2-methyltransferase [Nocardioides thalensis]|uniref:Trans-aconitate 2-methyltransferase n=1 Tax=Nocardioides thalensis TaxID=1914755 RepID=A0A853BZI7_9ACTN|nr:methyltransferase domain-containing protein [Nocardioides thalensis]NYI99881.1 trans-aconitate 2-methyltransferase [Nocardioides thalensis]